ncbi:MAG TPA: DUF4190 domain-containing protein [Gemmataceae bacterium]|nr:DUF4190 domain-containing protein [Gemmataceae bacterium]
MPADDDPEDDRPSRRREPDDEDHPARRSRDEDVESRPRRRPRDDEDDEFDDRPRRRRREPEPGIEATDFLIPTGVSGWSMAACYFGLFSCFIPLLGLVMALVALPCGIVALRQRKKKSQTYGSVTSDVRAIIGIITSSLTILGHLIVGIVILASKR